MLFLVKNSLLKWKEDLSEIESILQNVFLKRQDRVKNCDSEFNTSFVTYLVKIKR
jgi:hypothetical protein